MRCLLKRIKFGVIKPQIRLLRMKKKIKSSGKSKIIISNVGQFTFLTEVMCILTIRRIFVSRFKHFENNTIVLYTIVKFILYVKYYMCIIRVIPKRARLSYSQIKGYRYNRCTCCLTIEYCRLLSGA